MAAYNHNSEHTITAITALECSIHALQECKRKCSKHINVAALLNRLNRMTLLTTLKGLKIRSSSTVYTSVHRTGALAAATSYTYRHTHTNTHTDTDTHRHAQLLLIQYQDLDCRVRTQVSPSLSREGVYLTFRVWSSLSLPLKSC